ncbi:MAG TPA: hypothetical protein VMN04_09855 [Thermoanaerobaculia bacterium]|nr:hypothetical protein [Thermoanaerobaculia bacterium]
MKAIRYNDLDFTLERAGEGWTLLRAVPGGARAVAGTGLFPSLSEDAARERALALVRTICPVGVRSVGPDVAHPHRIGDLRIVGPDVAHPNFVSWDKDSVSCPKEPRPPGPRVPAASSD